MIVLDLECTALLTGIVILNYIDHGCLYLVVFNNSAIHKVGLTSQLPYCFIC